MSTTYKNYYYIKWPYFKGSFIWPLLGATVSVNMKFFQSQFFKLVATEDIIN